MIKNKDFFFQAIEKSDPYKTGFISFMNLRKVLENTNLSIKDKYIEFLIFLMKSYIDENSSLVDLKYNVRINFKYDFFKFNF